MGDLADNHGVSNKVEPVQLIKDGIRHHLLSDLGADPDRADQFRIYKALALTVKDELVQRWINTQRSYYDESAKRVYYLSLEFLLGRLLTNSLINLGMEDESRAALKELSCELEDVVGQEPDAGLGNGGLGRLAACFLDSIATLRLPAYGYGIRYDYGMFAQKIMDGYQVELPDNWMRMGNPWEFERPEFLYDVRFGGRVDTWTDEAGLLRHTWVEDERIKAMPCDVLIPGYNTDNVINLRLWAAKSTREFNLGYFQKGNYVEAVEEKARTENISKVLYPSEEVREGRELRLKQEYFFVSATFQDIMRRYTKRHSTFDLFPDRVAIQLNDTHPAIAIPEMMMILIDQFMMGWDKAWDLCLRTFGYTNHTVLPEALETWPVDILGSVLPRHLQIIYEINHRFLKDVADRYPGDNERLSRMSIIGEEPEKRVRMAHLAVVGSHSINGVAAVHTEIIKKSLFKDFYEMYPERFNNKTNGVTPRRWLLQANPKLSELITEKCGPDWPADLARLKGLEEWADDEEFIRRWRDAQIANKLRLSEYIRHQTGRDTDIRTIHDVHIKRFHEYKRQLLNILSVISRYIKLKQGVGNTSVGRTVIFGGKAAPGYKMAKLIIKLINSVAEVVNNDPNTSELLKVVFVPNYNVSAAEIMIPGAELSQQISTAGMEASGTGNMKFALNGALTIGTLDGANIEIAEAVGRENIFIFGLKPDEVADLRHNGYNPWEYYHRNEDLKTVLDMVASGRFSPESPELFRPIIDSLLYGGDYFMVLADFEDYLNCQAEVDRAYQDQMDWNRRSILNVARTGHFSTDRTILQYAEEIWGVKPLTKK